MPTRLIFAVNGGEVVDINRHLTACNDHFDPCLSDRICLETYSQKLFETAICFEAWDGSRLVGLLAAYCNDTVNKRAFVTNVSVCRDWWRQGLASRLLDMFLSTAIDLKLTTASLEVEENNIGAIHLYKKHGFEIIDKTGRYVCMSKTL